jgi:hypothetical protein
MANGHGEARRATRHLPVAAVGRKSMVADDDRFTADGGSTQPYQWSHQAMSGSAAANSMTSASPIHIAGSRKLLRISTPLRERRGSPADGPGCPPSAMNASRRPCPVDDGAVTSSFVAGSTCTSEKADRGRYWRNQTRSGLAALNNTSAESPTQAAAANPSRTYIGRYSGTQQLQILQRLSRPEMWADRGRPAGRPKQRGGSFPVLLRIHSGPSVRMDKASRSLFRSGT